MRVVSVERRRFFSLSFLFFFSLSRVYFILRAPRGVRQGGRWGGLCQLYRTPVLLLLLLSALAPSLRSLLRLYGSWVLGRDTTFFQGAQGAPLWGPSPPQRETHRRNMAAAKWSSPAVYIQPAGTARKRDKKKKKKKEKKRKAANENTLNDDLNMNVNPFTARWVKRAASCPPYLHNCRASSSSHQMSCYLSLVFVFYYLSLFRHINYGILLPIVHCVLLRALDYRSCLVSIATASKVLGSCSLITNNSERWMAFPAYVVIHQFIKRAHRADGFNWQPFIQRQKQQPQRMEGRSKAMLITRSFPLMDMMRRPLFLRLFSYEPWMMNSTPYFKTTFNRHLHVIHYLNKY